MGTTLDRSKSQQMAQRSVCCRNCGLNGHLYRDCPHPITSFGVMCYRVHPVTGELQYIMVQRKDSLSFMEFIRGKWDLVDTPYICQLLAGMTDQERQMLATASFNALWSHVWSHAYIPRHGNEYENARIKFERLRDGDGGASLEQMLQQSPNAHTEPEWGFPKGRRKLREDDVCCAIREFCEETGMCPADIQIVDSAMPYDEVFFGTNRVLYRHTYFVARYTGPYAEHLAVDPTNVGQMREIRALGWFDADGVLARIRSHNHERKQLFVQAHEHVRSMAKI